MTSQPVTPTDRSVFAPTVEGLVRGVGRQLTSTTKAGLRELGIDLDRPLKPGYPAVTWHRALELIARDVHPGASPSEAHRLLGARTVYGLEDTLVGKAMLAMIRLIGPRRALQRLPMSAKIGTNFVVTTVSELSPTEFEIVNAPFIGYAEVMQGAVFALAEIAGAKDLRVDVAEYDRAAERMVLRAKWT